MTMMSPSEWRKEMPKRLCVVVRQAKAAGYTHILAGGKPYPVPLDSWDPAWPYPMTLTRKGERICAADDISGGASETFYWLTEVR